MIIYNVTIQVETSIAQEWLIWLQNEHVPEILGTGCFIYARILKLLETDEEGGLTYTIQYTAESKAAYNQYISKYAPLLRQKSFDQWGDRFIAFRSVMQVVE